MKYLYLVLRYYLNPNLHHETQTKKARTKLICFLRTRIRNLFQLLPKRTTTSFNTSNCTN